MLTVNRINIGEAFVLEKLAPGQYRINKTNTTNVSEDVIIFNDQGIILLNPSAVESPAYNDVSKKFATTEWVIDSLSLAIPPGSVIYTASPNPLDGFLKCNGSAISRTTYSRLFDNIGTLYGEGNGVTSFNLPDYRGVFLRVMDDSKGLDPDRVLGSLQLDELKSHNHVDGWRNSSDDFDQGGGGAGQYMGWWNGGPVNTTSSTGGTETRPINMSVYAMIKY